MDRTQYLKDLRRIYDLAKNGERPCWVEFENGGQPAPLGVPSNPDALGAISEGRLVLDITQLSVPQLSHIADAVAAGKLHTRWEDGGRTKPKPPAVVIYTADSVQFHRGRGRTALDAMKEPAPCPMCEAGVPARQMEQLRVRKETDKSGRVYYRQVRVGEAREGDLIMHRYFTPAPAPAVEDLAKGEGIRGGEISPQAGATEARGKSTLGVAGAYRRAKALKAEKEAARAAESPAVARCECGAASVGAAASGPAHSRWCPVYRES